MSQRSTIADGEFANCSYIQKIKCNNVVTVEGYAFEECDSLKYITLPKVRIICDLAFYESGFLGISYDNAFANGVAKFKNLSQLFASAFTKCPIRKVIARSI